MRKLGLLCAFALCVAPVVGQRLEGSSQTALLCDEGAGCTHQFVNGHKIKILSADGITVSVSMLDTGKYFRADVGVLNTSSASLDVLPMNFSLEETAPKDKMLAYVDVGKIIRSAQTRMAWANALSAAGAGMQRQQTTTETTSNGTVNVYGSDGTNANGTYNGTSTSTTSSPDYAAQARADEAIRERNAVLAMQSGQLSSAALRSNTLSPGQSIGGFVFFQRKGKGTSLLLSMPVGDKVFKFPFAFLR